MTKNKDSLPNADLSEFRCGWVALMGPPNSGKSTLLNSILGQKVTIVTPRPQTTRNQIVGILTTAEAQVIFMDTPGIAQARGALSKTMIQAVWQSLSQAECILLLLDTSLYINHQEYLEKDMTPLIEALANDVRPVIVAANKIDLFADKARMLPFIDKIKGMLPKAEIFPISAQTGDGLPDLVNLIISKLPHAPAMFPEDQISTASLRFMSAEIIREKLFLHLRQELPYGVAVEIESWKEETERNLTVIHAVIYVSKSSHKGMVIGEGGSLIKEIGMEARKEIEELVGTRVHLELWVKVQENWTENQAFLHQLGNYAQ